MEDGEDETLEEKDSDSRDEILRSLQCFLLLAGSLCSLPQKTADKRKKEMAKQKASPETRRQKLEGWNAKTLLIQNLSHRVPQHELKEVFKDAFQIRLVSKDGMSKRIAYVDFKSQADAERALDEKRGTKIGGLAVVLGHVEEKSQGREGRASFVAASENQCPGAVFLRVCGHLHRRIRGFFLAVPPSPHDSLSSLLL
ncbi:nucleolin-like isoform X2 [Leptonychotes weddellii]|uniref:Nucleolin-like isoform X2 n=1 Tax=Leptonychotes weddellii TaxID=9713 RepID=A0A7F8QW01_LEPWE|nr:nucleolin-like isoform X2 [Leptonychotes weddellii]